MSDTIQNNPTGTRPKLVIREEPLNRTPIRLELDEQNRVARVVIGSASLKKIWFGCVTEDEVTGQHRTVSRGESDFLHRKFGYNAGVKWRFPAGGSEVFFWEPPTAEQVSLVREWLARRGELPKSACWTRWESGLRPEIIGKAEHSPASFKPWSQTIDQHH